MENPVAGRELGFKVLLGFYYFGSRIFFWNQGHDCTQTILFHCSNPTLHFTIKEGRLKGGGVIIISYGQMTGGLDDLMFLDQVYAFTHGLSMKHGFLDVQARPVHGD